MKIKIHKKSKAYKNNNLQVKKVRGVIQKIRMNMKNRVKVT
jgi:hypothetical protein